LFWIKTPFWLLRHFWRKVVISLAISEVERRYSNQSELPLIQRHGSMGVYGMDAGTLFIYFVFSNDYALKDAEAKGLRRKFYLELRESLKKFGYPVERLNEDFVSFVAQTAISKAGGDYFYFK
jgi:hypothetical protein